MQIEVLREFLELSSSLRYRAAAKRLHMSQSALSSHIAKLEQEIGSPLFLRDGGEARLSLQGKMLVEYACELIELHDKAIEALRDASSTREITLARPFSRDTLSFFLRISSQLSRECDSVDVSIKDVSSKSVFAAFETGEIDCFACHACAEEYLSESYPTIRVKKVELKQYPTRKVRVRADSELARMQTIGLEDLRGATFGLPASPGLESARVALGEFFKYLDFTPRVVLKSGDNVDEFRISLYKEDAICLIPQDSVEMDGYLIKEIDTGRPETVNAYVRIDDSRPELQKLVDIIEREAASF